jgi:catechol 2,3-dioxygenase-like lactoylglutathione lyase family enzyme
MKDRFYYAGIRVRNLPRSLTFYTRALGMKPDNQGTMGHGGKYVQLVSPGSKMRIELNWYPPGSRFATRYTKGEELDHLAFVVDDVEKAYKDLLQKGAKSVVSPAKAKADKVEVYVKDPDGIWIELLQS